MSGNLTHAGGVVIRTDGDAPRVLVVSAKRSPDEWVLPKGHIEANEKARETAVREVLEESGVEAVVEDKLSTEEFTTSRGDVRAKFFLMTFVREGSPGEGRRRGWLTADQADAEVTFPVMKSLIARAFARCS